MPPPSNQSEKSALDLVLARRAEFRAFLVSRLGSEADADDVLQNGLIKALRSAADLRDDQKVTAWFYQVLRNAIVDHIRSRRAQVVRDDQWAEQNQWLNGDDEVDRVACRCVERLIEELNPREGELLRKVELQSEPVAEAARASGITANSASVTLHRARRKLREQLEAFCGECAGGACLDCDCGSAPAVPHAPPSDTQPPQ